MSLPGKQHNPGFLALVERAKQQIRSVDLPHYEELLRANEGGQLIDVREDNEWDAAHAAGALHMSKGIIERDIETAFPDKNARLVLYCGGGYRSALAAYNLQQMGYTNVLSLEGGWRAIEGSDLPIERRSS